MRGGRGGAGPGGAEDLADELDLVLVVAAGEERLAQEQLREDAAHAPHVERLGVARPREQHLPGRGAGFDWRGGRVMD